MNAELQKELEQSLSSDFKLGEYIYMGMGLVKEHQVCLSVGYKVDYCFKKARQFEELDKNVTFTHISKVKVGELEKCKKIRIS
ncbi:MAG: hypothetical protein KGV44_10380 [Flavobacteriaceae bacterium]|nr:hypothetical protein [Flavobacteriaceae bacterium]